MNALLKKRIKKAKKLTTENKIDALIIENPIDIYYLTGQAVSTGTLLITKNQAHLLVDGRYYETCRKKAPIPVTCDDGHALEKILAQKKAIINIAFDGSFTTFTKVKKLQKKCKQASKKLKKSIQTQSLDEPIKEIRAIKDDQELNILKRASNLGLKGYDVVVNNLKQGISEEELVCLLEKYWLNHGAKCAFEPIIAFGENSAYPHHHSGKRKLKKGDTVLIDIGVEKDRYCSDMTRVVFFKKPNPKILKIYSIVLEAQKKALKICKPKTKITDLDKVSRKYIEDAGYGKQYTHRLGHGVGLEIHESPTICLYQSKNKLTLANGMVLTIEPGIYLPGIGGVRIEDTVAITKKGHINLTKRPKSIQIV